MLARPSDCCATGSRRVRVDSLGVTAAGPRRAAPALRGADTVGWTLRGSAAAGWPTTMGRESILRERFGDGWQTAQARCSVLTASRGVSCLGSTETVGSDKIRNMRDIATSATTG